MVKLSLIIMFSFLLLIFSRMLNNHLIFSHCMIPAFLHLSEYIISLWFLEKALAHVEVVSSVTMGMLNLERSWAYLLDQIIIDDLERDNVAIFSSFFFEMLEGYFLESEVGQILHVIVLVNTSNKETQLASDWAVH